MAASLIKVAESVRTAGIRHQVMMYCRLGTLPAARDIVIDPEPSLRLVSDLHEGRIDAGIRGSLPANETLSLLKRAFRVDQLERIALLETRGGVRFLLAPVGVDEGWTVAERCTLARKAQSMAGKFGISTRIGVLSGGRLGDIGRCHEVDRSLADGELVARLTGARHAEILIEEAVKDCGVIIAPDGITGNLIFRTLVFLGEGTGHGAPVANIDKIFVDTSRASPNYSNAIRLAELLLDK